MRLRTASLLPIALLISLAGLLLMFSAHGRDATLVGLGFWLSAVVGPGLIWSHSISRRLGDALGALIIGQAVSLGLAIVLGLLMALVGLPFHLPPVTTLAVILLAISIAVSWTKLGAAALGPSSPEIVASAALLLLAAAVRLPGLSYSELQGDEIEVVVRASAIAQGAPGAIFYYSKAPAEVILTSFVYGAADSITETAARLPFSLANMIAMLAAAVLGSRLFGNTAGMFIGAIAAVLGYYVAFARIVQYQSLVLFFGTAALLAIVPRPGESRFRAQPLLAGFLLGLGLLSHYDAIFAAVPVGLFALLQIAQDSKDRLRRLTVWGIAGVISLAIPAMFFLPYSLSPLSAQGVDRVAGRVGDIALRNNLDAIVSAASLYTSFPVLLCLLALATIGLASMARDREHRLAWLVTWVWLLVPVIGYVFIVRKPGTHAHVALLPLLLLAGAALGSLASWRGTHPGQVLGATFCGLLCVGIAAQDFALYLQTSPEVIRANQFSQTLLGMGPTIPRKERFGFPYQAGWKAVGNLFSTGELSGSFDTNENPQVSWWYTRGAWRCTSNPRYYVIADLVQDEIEPPRRRLASEYAQIGSVAVNQQTKIRVYERKPTQTPPFGVRDARIENQIFDEQRSGIMLDPGVWARGPIAPRLEGSPIEFPSVATWLGYRIYAEEPRPGGVAQIDLYWRAQYSGERYAPSLRIGRSPTIGDGDGPGCDKSRAWLEWQDQQAFAQRLSVNISPNVAPGSYPILVRIVDTTTGQAVPSQDGSDPEQEIGQLTIRG